MRISDWSSDVCSSDLRPVALELLEPVAGRNPEVADLLSGVQDEQLAQRGPLGGLVEPLRSLSAPHPLGVPVSERLQHSAHYNDTRYERKASCVVGPCRPR